MEKYKNDGTLPVTYEVNTYDISNLEGKLLTFIDATVLDKEQRKAQKDIIRQMLWEWIFTNRKGKAEVFIGEKLHIT